MKKFISFLMICLTLVAFSGCGNSEAENALNNMIWCCNAGYEDNGEDNNITRFYEFIDGEVWLGEIEVGYDDFLYDPVAGTYKVDKDSVVLSFDGREDVEIPYVMDGENIKLNEGVYFSPQDVEEAIQGHWYLRIENKPDEITGWDCDSEYHVEFNDGYVKAENATEPLNGGPGEYFYYGPYEGDYIVGLGEFEVTDYDPDENYMIQSTYFYHIHDCEVRIYKGADPMERGGEFPGEHGYKFDGYGM